MDLQETTVGAEDLAVRGGGGEHSGMDRVLKLLKSTPYSVLPDPKVAAILFDSAGKEIASYSKRYFGEPHSEAQVILKALKRLLDSPDPGVSANELEQARACWSDFRQKLFTPRSVKDDSDLQILRTLTELLKQPFRDAALFVNLEPCSHFGKNPACANVIAAAGVKQVCFSSFDPDPDVQGQGERVLLDSGVTVVHGVSCSEALQLNSLFCQISYYLPKLFDYIQPTSSPQTPAYTMLGLYVPKGEIRSSNYGKDVRHHTFGTPPQHTVARLKRHRRPSVSPSKFNTLPRDPDGVLFTTLLNPPAIVDMLYNKFKRIPHAVVSAMPDMSFDLGKEECIDTIKEYIPGCEVCVGVRMVDISDKLARISLRRRLSAEIDKTGKVAIVVLAMGVPNIQTKKVETKYAELVSATTLHVSRLEEYLLMLAFVREDVKVNLYLSGDVFYGKWREKHVVNFRKMMARNKNLTMWCTEEDVVRTLKSDKIPRVNYLEPFWEIVE